MRANQQKECKQMSTTNTHSPKNIANMKYLGKTATEIILVIIETPFFIHVVILLFFCYNFKQSNHN